MITSSSQSSSLISRQSKLKSILQSSKLDSMIVNAGPSLTYLTGLNFHLSERPVVVIFTLNQPPIIVLPELEKEKLTQLPFEIQAFQYGEDPSLWGEAFLHAIRAGKLASKRIGVEPRQLRLLEYDLLINGAPKAEFIPAGEVLAQLRMCKDESEIRSMREAVRIAEQALAATLPLVKIGMSERDLTSELTLQLYRAGCDPQIPFSPIVSSGLNSANPHAAPSNKKISLGDLLVIDWGASYGGYYSDITRTFACGDIEQEFVQIGKIVLEANTAGRRAAAPGVAIERVDQAARAVIEAAGYRKYFTHRTGHGLGMEGHEEPYIRQGNSMPFQNGMTFTVEPGIYLPGRNGVRIEDDVVITPSGAETLTSLPRDLRKLI